LQNLFLQIKSKCEKFLVNKRTKSVVLDILRFNNISTSLM